MPTPKTPLPKKVTGPDTVGLGYWPGQIKAMFVSELVQSYNQLLEHLKEREEAQPEKPSLKETLLEEIDKIEYPPYGLIFHVEALEKAKSIINRVLRDNAN